jgi:aryl sulfotransferase
MTSATKTVVWIASYPKSGNTWARFLACNLLHGSQESAAALNGLAPDVHELLAAANATPAADGAPTADGAPPAELLKTHFALSEGLPYLDRTRAAIYIVRDPADVLTSNFFYSMRSMGSADASPAAFDAYLEEFIEHRGDPRWIERGMGSWEDNVRSWRSAAGFPVLGLRYEDMIAEPLAAGRAIAALLRPQATDSEVREAVQNSSFERMREIERADIRAQRIGIFYKPYLHDSIARGNRFMRRGIVGDGDARLSAAQRTRLRQVFGPLLHELGYAHTRDP